MNVTFNTRQKGLGQTWRDVAQYRVAHRAVVTVDPAQPPSSRDERNDDGKPHSGRRCGRPRRRHGPRDYRTVAQTAGAWPRRRSGMPLQFLTSRPLVPKELTCHRKPWTWQYRVSTSN